MSPSQEPISTNNSDSNTHGNVGEVVADGAPEVLEIEAAFQGRRSGHIGHNRTVGSIFQKGYHGRSEPTTQVKYKTGL